MPHPPLRITAGAIAPERFVRAFIGELSARLDDELAGVAVALEASLLVVTGVA